MNKVAIYPGTFDPITFGHIDVFKPFLITSIWPNVIGSNVPG